MNKNYDINKMKNELNDNNVIDNPFDRMLYNSIELTRCLLFASHRLKNNEVLSTVVTNKDEINYYMNSIKEEFSKLQNMSDETVSLCRETSSYYNQDKFNKMNDTLLKIEDNLDTIYNKDVPCRDDRFEKVKLGENSDKYQRMIELRKIMDKSRELSHVSEVYLSSLIDIIYFQDGCVPNFMSQKEFSEKSKIIKKYNLSEEDIKYMISYIDKEY